MISGGVGRGLGARELSKLLIRVFPVEDVNRIPRGIHLAFPIRQIANLVSAENLPVGIVDKQKPKADAVVLHDAERLVGEVIDAAQLCEIGSPHRRLHRQAPVLQIGRHLFNRHGRGKIVALNLLTSDCPQELKLLFGLHTLCQRGDVQLLRHPHDGDEDLPGLLIKVLEKRHVELQLVKGILFQNAEGRIPRPEVIHPDLIAHLVEPADEGVHLVHVFDKGALRDFQVGELPRHAVLSGDPLDGIREVVMQKVLAGEVHRDRDQVAAPLLSLHIVAAYLLEHVEVQLVDLAGLLQDGDEPSRGDHAVHRIDPPHQRLTVADGCGHRPDHGLIIDLNPAVLQRLVKVPQDVKLACGVLLDAAVKPGIGGNFCLLDGFAGKSCLITGIGQSRAVVSKPNDPRLYGQVVSAIQLSHLGK